MQEIFVFVFEHLLGRKGFRSYLAVLGRTMCEVSALPPVLILSNEKKKKIFCKKKKNIFS